MYQNLFIRSPSDGHWVLHVLTIINEAAVNSPIQVFLWTCVFIILDKYLGVELLCH